MLATLSMGTRVPLFERTDRSRMSDGWSRNGASSFTCTSIRSPSSDKSVAFSPAKNVRIVEAAMATGTPRSAASPRSIVTPTSGLPPRHVVSTST